MNRHGEIRPHAAVAIETASRIAFARMIREIGLDLAEPDFRPPAPPRIEGSNAD